MLVVTPQQLNLTHVPSIMQPQEWKPREELNLTVHVPSAMHPQELNLTVYALNIMQPPEVNRMVYVPIIR